LATLDRPALEQRLAQAEARLERLLRPNEKYDRAERSPETEARARELLDKDLRHLSSAEHSYDVECHGTYCKLTILDDKVHEDAMRAVQTDFAFRSWMVGSDVAYTELPDRASAAQGQLISSIGNAIMGSSELPACKAQYPTTSTTMVHVTLDVAKRTLVATMAGPQAKEPVGACVGKAFEDLLRGIAVSPEVRSMPDFPIPFPLPGP
jgi:hypothetical protein